jgi:hypothetical protein
MNEKLRNSGTNIIENKQAAENSFNVAYRRNLQTYSLDFMSPVIKKIAGFTHAPDIGF